MQTQSQPTPRPAAQAAAIKAFADAGLSLLDKPAPRAWATRDTIWFSLPRRAGPTHLRAGSWIPVTRTYKATPKRRATIAKWKAAHVISGIETDGSDSHDNRPTRTLEAAHG